MRKKILASIGLIVAICALLFFIFRWVCDRDWSKFLSATKDAAEIIAVAIGGGWTWYLFWIQRENEPAVGIKLDYKCAPNGNEHFLACFDVTFSNVGKVRIQGRKARNPAYPVGKDRKDEEETLKYGCSLLIRPVPRNLPANTLLDWFNQESGERGKELNKLFFDIAPIETDLLYDYAIKVGGTEITDFWMEPGEAYDVSVSVVLPPGVYLGIVTFLGENNDGELWRRKTFIEIPKKHI